MQKLRKIRRTANEESLLHLGAPDTEDVAVREASPAATKRSGQSIQEQQGEPSAPQVLSPVPSAVRAEQVEDVTASSGGIRLTGRNTGRDMWRRPTLTGKDNRRAFPNVGSLKFFKTLGKKKVPEQTASPCPSPTECDPVHPWPEPPEDYNSEPEIERSHQASQPQQAAKSVGLWIHSLYRAVVMVNRLDKSYARKMDTVIWPFLARYMTRSEFETRMQQLEQQMDREHILPKPVTQAQKEKTLAQASQLFDHVYASLRDEGSATESDDFQAAVECFRQIGGFRFKPKPSPDPTDGDEEFAEIASRVGPGTYAGQRSKEEFMNEMGEVLDDVDAQHELLSHPPFGDKDWGEVEAAERRIKVWGKRKAVEVQRTSPDYDDEVGDVVEGRRHNRMSEDFDAGVGKSGP